MSIGERSCPDWYLIPVENYRLLQDIEMLGKPPVLAIQTLHPMSTENLSSCSNGKLYSGPISILSIHSADT
jgi:hypothetical protein